MSKKIYVTGHDGFVGTHLVKKLKERDHEVLTSTIDLRDAQQTKDFFMKNKPDWVFNCAAIVGGIKANIKEPYKFLFENLQIQNNVIDACLKHNVKKVLFLGSSCIYPTKNNKQPLVEEDLLASPVEPTNEGYAIAKIAGLKLCEYANRTQNKTKFIALMPCNLYGPGDHFDLETSHVIPSLIKKIVDAKRKGEKSIPIWGSGEPRREFMFVEDVVDGMVWTMDNIENTKTFLNIGSGKDISIKEIISKIVEFIGYDGEFNFDLSKPDGMMQRCMDVSKINNLGWKTTTEFKNGLESTIEYYRSLKS